MLDEMSTPALTPAPVASPPRAPFLGLSTLWVQITGHDAKEFIAEEFAPLGKKLAAAGPQR